MLAFVVFLNGMAVMVLEMAGARLLAPELGSSIIVWTGLIGVILASLSLGYWLGGRLADRVLLPAGTERSKKAHGPAGHEAARGSSGHEAAHKAVHEAVRGRAFALLSTLLLLASVSVFITAAIGNLAPGALTGLFSSLYAKTVFSALVLFGPPSLLCGMVSPYAVRLGIRGSETSGAVIGRLNAIATAGSIAGTFLGGFVLLAWFSTGGILLGVAVCLLAASLLVRARPLLPKAALGLLLIAAMLGNAAYARWIEETGFFKDNMPVSIETQYSSLRVAQGTQDGRKVVLLQTDPGSAQSGMFSDDPLALMFEYTRFYALGTAMNPAAKRILMLGGGGYSVPKWLLSGRSELSSQDFSLDVVELDPGMTATAARYFKAPLDDGRMRVLHEDARAFVNRAAAQVPENGYGPYDLIFADIFNSWYSVPFHVGTEEAALRIRSLLSEDGIYIMNIISAVSGDNGRLLRSIRNAFVAAFGEVHIFPVHSRHNGAMVQNVMLLAFRRPRPLPDPEKERVAPHIARMLAQRWTSPFPAPEADVPALRDGFAPVERYTLGFLQ